MDSETSRAPLGLYSEKSYLGTLHHHAEYEIFHLLSGQVIFGIDNDRHTLHPGDVIFLEPGVRHSVVRGPDNGDYHYHALVFDISALGGEGDACRTTLESLQVQRFLSLPAPLLDKFGEAALLEKDKSFGRELRLKALLYEFLAAILATRQFLPVVPEGSSRGSRPCQGIEKALVWIRTHYREPISLDRVVREAHYSKSHFLRLFRSATGMHLTEYVNTIRVEKSCLALIHSAKSVTRIATENGFGTVQYFSRVFRRCMQCTPLQYRIRGKSILVPSSQASISG